MIHHIIGRLGQSANLSQYVNDRIFPLVRAQNSELPCAVVQMVSMRANDTKESSSALFVYTVHVTMFASDPETCWRCSIYARNILNNWSGNDDVKQVRLVDMASDVFEATEAFSFTQEFDVFSTE